MILMPEIRWSHDFVCAVRDSDVVCNTGLEYSRIGRAGSFKGNKLVASNIHRQTIDPSEKWSKKGAEYSPLKLQSSVGNIIGCILDKRTKTIQCVEGEDTQEGRRRVAGEIEVWLTIVHD